jgi:hypothetical protein
MSKDVDWDVSDCGWGVYRYCVVLTIQYSTDIQTIYSPFPRIYFYNGQGGASIGIDLLETSELHLMIIDKLGLTFF